MKNRILLLLLPLVFCQCEMGPPPANIFEAEPELVTLYNHQDQRNVEGVLPYLSHEKELIRERAALAFGSMLDTNTLSHLVPMLQDPSPTVRKAVAYSLGQMRHDNAEEGLLSTLQNEKDPEVKIALLEALGKCGSALGLFQITELKTTDDPALQEGQARAIYRFTLQGEISAEGTKIALELIQQGHPEAARFYAAHYLARTRSLDLAPFSNDLLNAYSSETVLQIQLPLVLAMGKAITPAVEAQLIALCENKSDFRLRVMALRALRFFEGQGVEKAVWSQLSDSVAQVSELAATWWKAKGNPGIANDLFLKARDLTHWRTKAYLMEAAVKYGGEKQSTYTEVALNLYNASENSYEKGALLKALIYDPVHFTFLLNEPFGNGSIPLKTAALEALIEFRKMPAFAQLAENPDQDAPALYLDVLKKAIATGDPSLAGIAATALRDPEIDYGDGLKDQAFLQDALDRVSLPREVETANELKRTLAFLNNEKYSPSVIKPDHNPIDWSQILTLPKNQKMLIKTSKGDIEIRLLVEEAPGSVANFLGLIKEGFYNDFVFHRVVPGFVVQDGCPRGDGWGSPDRSIRSEFFPHAYGEGAIGMASAGPDTESSQWFITHVPTPHLDGRYTIFAQVEKGMDVVQQLDLGDVVDYELPPAKK